MRVVGVTLRDFRTYETAHVEFGDGLTVVSGANGAGKTNLLEAVYFGCLGRSCRTGNERELVRFGAGSTRVVVDTAGEDGPHELAVGFSPGEAKRIRIDGAPVERLLDSSARPLVSVFLPDRLELVKGPPAVRRAHLDQLVYGLWPSRVGTRRAYAQALAQRNALLARVRATGGGRSSLPSWDAQLARHGIELMSDRRAAIEAVAERFTRLGEQLGMELGMTVAYRPRSHALAAEELASELGERADRDLERGFTSHGPHRDDFALLRAGRDLRAYGSQGQQRIALLALLLAEREAIGEARDALPLLLLDDVMSELDATRRLALVRRLRTSGGQSVITTTDLEHVPGAAEPGVVRVGIAEGKILQAAVAA
jgi:DNA replication and repair protein RecF